MRLISVGSILVRCWLGALAHGIPQPCDNQGAGKRGVSVVHAISKWLAEVSQSDAGSELDLSRACDFIDHEVAEAALLECKSPDSVVYTAFAAWTAPRTLGVGGTYAPAVYPDRGLPQGDSVAPAGMIACLTPWQPNNGQACMDDRSLTNAITELVQDDVAFTEKLIKMLVSQRIKANGKSGVVTATPRSSSSTLV